jgi:hypothetical protein
MENTREIAFEMIEKAKGKKARARIQRMFQLQEDMFGE